MPEPWRRAEEGGELTGRPGLDHRDRSAREARAQRIGPGLAPAREDVGAQEWARRPPVPRPRVRARWPAHRPSPRCARPRHRGGHRSRCEGEWRAAPPRRAGRPRPIRRCPSGAGSRPHGRCPGRGPRRRGTTWSRHIGCSSRGGPGSATKSGVTRVDPPAGRGAVGVRQGLGAGDEPGLLEVRRREGDAAALPELPQPGLQGRIDRRLAPRGRRRWLRASGHRASGRGRRR